MRLLPSHVAQRLKEGGQAGPPEAEKHRFLYPQFQKGLSPLSRQPQASAPLNPRGFFLPGGAQVTPDPNPTDWLPVVTPDMLLEKVKACG